MQDGQRLLFQITQSEIAMGGIESFKQWLRVADTQIMAHHSAYQQLFSNQAIDTGNHNTIIGYGAVDVAPLYGWNMANQQWPVREEDAKATEKAKDLFKLACGAKAFETLDSGKPLPTIGSKGTKYTLHKRSTYCVERTKDGAKLCAVVPGVPLWDHLLGIRLMVENDEPAFLKTANVAGGHHPTWAQQIAGYFTG